MLLAHVSVPLSRSTGGMAEELLDRSNIDTVLKGDPDRILQDLRPLCRLPYYNGMIKP